MHAQSIQPNQQRCDSAKKDHRAVVPPVIVFDHVTKTYRLYKSDRGRFFGLFRFENRDLIGTIRANKDLSFTISRGESVALLGHNGAGKSTALKIVTGVTYPESGTVEVRGRVSALLELTAGFDGQLTGRENIRLRGLTIGLSHDEIEGMEADIVSFAELGVYIDQPMRTYSSGMKARLGFAFAVAIEPEILVIDEALAVGDTSFQKKCIARIHEIMSDRNVTVLFVTHTSKLARELCSRGIVLDHGANVFDGPIKQAIAFYDDLETQS
jgi:teichoic acid transport system ATP-binding protein